MTFIAVILILIGFYASLRTLTNLIFFDKYPQQGVLAFNFSGVPYYPQREEDCSYMPYLEIPGEVLSEEQKQVRTENERHNCLIGVQESRVNAKINDISQSALFLFLGFGLLAAKRIFKL